MQQYSEEALLDAVKTLVAIKSTVDNPAGLSAAYEFMRSLLLDCDKDITIEEFESGGKPSLLAYRGQTRPDRFHIILNAHIDVVPGKPDQYEPVELEGKLFGRGTYDMKAAAVIMMQVFCEYVDKVPYALALQIVTDEEGSGNNGTGYQVEQGVRADFIISGECGRAVGTYEIANESKGVAAFILTFDGVSSHGAYPWRGDNAALKATEFVRRLHEFFPVPQSDNGETTLTVTGVVADGASHNQIPETATVKLDCRYIPGDPHFENVDTIANFIHSIEPDATISQFINYGPPMYANPRNPLLLDLKAAAKEVEGREFTFVRHNGTSDGRFYSAVGGEACEFGIVGEHQHTDGEYITLEAFWNYLETMRAFLHKTVSELDNTL